MIPVDFDVMSTGEPAFEHLFQGTLWQDQHKREIAGASGYFDLSPPPLAIVETDRVDAAPEIDDLLGQTDRRQKLDGRGMQRTRIAVRGRARFFINHLYPNAALSQEDCGDHPYRTCTGHQHFGCLFTKHTAHSHTCNKPP